MVVLTPISEPVRRRLIAATLAFAVNSALVGLLLFTHRPIPLEPDFDVVEITFVTLPQPEQPPETVEAEAEEQDIPVEQEPVEDAAPNQSTPLPEPSITALPAAPGDSDEDEDEDDEDKPPAVGLARFSGEPLPFDPGRGSTADTLRGIFCLNSSDATRDAGDCPHDQGESGLAMLQYANSGHDLSALQEAFALNLSPDQIRALFGQAPHELSGQPTLDTTSRRPTSSADEMRDTLPASIPDPAFGD